MPTASLNREFNAFIGGKDCIIIVRDLGDIPGGRTLDLNGYAESVVNAGHVVIKKEDGTFALLAVNDGAYAELGENESYAGVVKASFLAKNPQASIMTTGQVQGAALHVPVTEAIKSGLPRIEFL